MRREGLGFCGGGADIFAAAEGLNHPAIFLRVLHGFTERTEVSPSKSCKKSEPCRGDQSGRPLPPRFVVSGNMVGRVDTARLSPLQNRCFSKTCIIFLHLLKKCLIYFVFVVSFWLVMLSTGQNRLTCQ